MLIYVEKRENEKYQVKTKPMRMPHMMSLHRSLGALSGASIEIFRPFANEINMVTPCFTLKIKKGQNVFDVEKIYTKAYFEEHESQSLALLDALSEKVKDIVFKDNI